MLVAAAFIPLKAVLVLLGLAAVPVALWQYDKTGGWPTTLDLWHNDEDPVWGLPFWYTERYAPYHWAAKRFPRFWWFAVRNPANNMRRWFRQRSFKESGWDGYMDPRVARAAGKRAIFRYRWNGLLADMWVIVILSDTRHFRARLGWKLGQWDLGEYAGFAMQLMPYRRG